MSERGPFGIYGAGAETMARSIIEHSGSFCEIDEMDVQSLLYPPAPWNSYELY